LEDSIEMKTRFHTFATAALAAAVLTLTSASVFAAAPRVVKITGTEDMRYSVTRIEAAPGETIKIQLTAKGNQAKEAMAHNFVLLAPGVDMGPFITQATMARSSGYIPASFKAKILAFSPLAGAGETVEVTFNAPAKPGDYTYLCTFPAHFTSGMKGVLVVKADGAKKK
jgi:azurin